MSDRVHNHATTEGVKIGLDRDGARRCFASARDTYGFLNNTYRQYPTHSFLFQSCNTDVMVIDLVRWREGDYTDQWVPPAQTDPKSPPPPPQNGSSPPFATTSFSGEFLRADMGLILCGASMEMICKG
nr:hypothetical protein [Tanacetum cinerariifolium]